MVLSVTVPLTRRQQLRLYRFRSGQWLVTFWYVTRVRWATKRVCAGWVKRVILECHSGRKADRS